MRYLVTGSTEANHKEVIKSLESLWDAADAQDEPFILVLVKDTPPSDTMLAIVKWAEETECLIETTDDPYAVGLTKDDPLLVLAGEEPDDKTSALIRRALDMHHPVLDLASQLIQIEFEEDPEPAETLPSAGWPGEAPEDAWTPVAEAQAPVVAPEPQRAAESVREDPAVILEGVTERDLENMGAEELRALLDRLYIEGPDRRKKDDMVRAILDAVVEVAESDPPVPDGGIYAEDADEFFAQREDDLRVKAGAVREALDKVESVLAPRTPIADLTPSEVLAVAGIAYVTGMLIEVIYSDGTSKKKMSMAPFSVEEEAVIASV